MLRKHLGGTNVCIVFDMGMFDYLYCRTTLPSVGKCEELKDVKWDEVEFQTKSLMNAFHHFIINDKGELVERQGVDDSFWSLWSEYQNDTNIAHIPYNHHGVIEFYTNFQKTKYDYFVTYKAIFTHGKLEALLLKEFEKKDNLERLKKEAAYLEYRNDIEIKRNKWWYPMYKYLYAQPILKFGRLLRKVAQRLSNWSLKMEKCLVKFR